MATNSFLLKAWSVTLVSAMFALAGKDANRRYVLIAYFPAITFWVLDGYFMSQEKRFRDLYDRVRGRLDSPSDLSMSTEPVATFRNGWLASMLSKTVAIFHIALVGTTITVMYLV
jgi:hypothetical protein